MLSAKILKTDLISSKMEKIRNVRFFSNICEPQIEPIKMSFKSYDNFKSDPSIDFDIPPLIIMHGILGTKRNWNSLSKALNERTKPHRKVIAVDARNHGDSPYTKGYSYPLIVEDIKFLLNRLEIERAALLGHSMGARAMMYFSVKYPEFVEKLIAVEMSPNSTSASFTSLTAVFSTIDQLELPSTNMPVAKARKQFSKQLAPILKDKEIHSLLLSNLIRGPAGKYVWRFNVKDIYENFIENINRFPNVGGLTFDGPTLFISAENSDYIRKVDHPRILEIFPKTEFVTIKDTGHLLQVNKPSEFIKTCTDFLDKEH